MPRELNPEFSNSSRVHDQSPGAAANTSLSKDPMLKEHDFVSGTSSEKDFRRQVNFQLEQIRRRQRDSDEKVEGLIRAIKQTQEIQRLRSEQLNILQREMEKFVGESLQKLSSKFSVRFGKLHEKMAGEHKVQELIDRHTQVVQRFEMRLDQLQRLMGEQDIKLLSYSDTLKEIRRQLPHQR